jgi:hypothetical protein
LRSGWGWLSLLTLALPFVYQAVLASEAATLQRVLLFCTFGLGLAGQVILFQQRDRLWLYELTQRLIAQTEAGFADFRLGLLEIGGLGFLLFVGVGGWLIGLLGGAIGARQALLLPAREAGVLLGVISVAFILVAWSAGLYAVYSYGQWRSRTFPAPIFLNPLELRQLVEQEALLRIHVKARRSKALMMQVLSAMRTRQGGVKLEVRAERPTQKVDQGHFLQAVQYWQAVANCWGKISTLEQDGPEAYIVDLARPYHPPSVQPKQTPQSLEGDLIVPDESVSASMEEAIINAVIASGIKRRFPTQR